MTFDDWKASAALVFAGPDMPDHAAEMGVTAAWVFADDSFIKISISPFDKTAAYVIHLGNEEESFDPTDRGFFKAAKWLWESHASDNQPRTVWGAIRQGASCNDLGIAVRCVMDMIGHGLDGGVAGVMFSGLEEGEWAKLDHGERVEMLRDYAASEVRHLQ